MIREIKKKMVILTNRMSFPDEVKSYLSQLEEGNWLWTNLRLEGSIISKDGLDKILDGQMLGEVSISEHMLVEDLINLRQIVRNEARNRSKIDSRLLGCFAQAISLEREYRMSTPILREYTYVPPLPAEIPKLMHEFFEMCNLKEEIENPFEKAAKIHCDFIRIWPYREKNTIIARALMEYYLLINGYPMVDISLDEVRYNTNLAEYLKGGYIKWLSEDLMSACIRSLELMIQLTPYRI